MATYKNLVALTILVLSCTTPVISSQRHQSGYHLSPRVRQQPVNRNNFRDTQLLTKRSRTTVKASGHLPGASISHAQLHDSIPPSMYSEYEQRLSMQGWSMSSPKGSLRIVAVCHRHWHGIKSATEALGFPLVLRDDQSDAVWNAMFLAALRHVNVGKILINGIPPGTADLAALLRANGRIVYLTYHGSFVQHVGYAYSVAESDAFASALTSLTQGDVSRLGLLKVEMIGVIKSMGINAFPLNNLVDQESVWTKAPKFRTFDGMLHIGILGRGSLGKNLMTQVVAACTLSRVVVHVLKLEHEAAYLKLCKSNVVRHHEMDHTAFRRLLAQMDINVYASLHECQPMVALESIAAGVPCIISDTSTIYSYDARLEKQLVCNRPDSSDSIQACIRSTQEALAKAELKGVISSYIDTYNTKACSLMEEFLQEKGSDLPSRFQRICHTTLSNATNIVQESPQNGNLALNTALAKHAGDVTIGHCQRTDLSSSTRDDYLRTASVTNGSIVLATYELDGVTPGGAGVLITALAKQLATSGINVILLADMPASECRQWAAAQASRYGKLMARVRVVSVYDLGVSYDGSKGDEFVAKSILWADAAEAVSKTYNVAAIEFFEYAGPAAALLARRTQGTSSLPDRVAVYVRVHGSLEMIDAAEGVDPTSSRLRMYMMERFAMAAADAVIYPSTSMRKLYEASVGNIARRSLVGTPPIKAMLAAIPPRPSRRQQKNVLCKPDRRMFNFLVLGKIQKIKNSALVAQAAVQLLESKAGHRATVTFVGSSFRNVDTQTDPVDEVLAIIPQHLKNRVFVCPRVGRAELNALLPLYSASIVASAFESFNIVAHEMYAAGLPLVISDFDAFKDFFSSNNAFIFQRGNVSDLAAQMMRAMTTKIRPPQMLYQDAEDAYHCLRQLDVMHGRYVADGRHSVLDLLRRQLGDLF